MSPVCRKRSRLGLGGLVLCALAFHACALLGEISRANRQMKQLASLILASQAVLAPLAGLTVPPPALAFDNAVPNTYTMPKTKGPAPANLGIGKDGLLRACLKPSPNCFSTTPEGHVPGQDGEEEEEANIWGVDHTIKPWDSRGKKSPDEAFSAIKAAVEAYVPGQGGVDGGGWKIVVADPQSRYLYVQYEALRRGYIDDVEFAINQDSTTQVVSSSRLGYLDFQVNAKRLNYLRSLLLPSGFMIEEITSKTHPVYFDANRDVAEVRAAGKEAGRLGSKKY